MPPEQDPQTVVLTSSRRLQIEIPESVWTSGSFGQSSVRALPSLCPSGCVSGWQLLPRHHVGVRVTGGRCPLQGVEGGFDPGSGSLLGAAWVCGVRVAGGGDLISRMLLGLRSAVFSPWLCPLQNGPAGKQSGAENCV